MRACGLEKSIGMRKWGPANATRAKETSQVPLSELLENKNTVWVLLALENIEFEGAKSTSKWTYHIGSRNAKSKPDLNRETSTESTVAARAKKTHMIPIGQIKRKDRWRTLYCGASQYFILCKMNDTFSLIAGVCVCEFVSPCLSRTGGAINDLGSFMIV